MAKKQEQASITDILGITEKRFLEIAKQIKHNKIDADNMGKLFKMSAKGYDKEAVLVGYLIGRMVADNEQSHKGVV